MKKDATVGAHPTENKETNKMNTSTMQIPSMELALRAIDRLDLRKVQARLMQTKRWTLEKTKTAVKWYRRFLKVAVKHPEARIVPNVLIDEVWHQHLLDTRPYARDCQTIFGGFMHHNPGFGETPEGVKQLRVQFAQTNELYCAEFGADCIKSEPLFELRKSAKSCLAVRRRYAECTNCE